ncbi:hypothetical protein HK405_013747, partial [Cladochytrium tenue]
KKPVLAATLEGLDDASEAAISSDQPEFGTNDTEAHGETAATITDDGAADVEVAAPPRPRPPPRAVPVAAISPPPPSPARTAADVGGGSLEHEIFAALGVAPASPTAAAGSGPADLPHAQHPPVPRPRPPPRSQSGANQDRPVSTASAVSRPLSSSVASLQEPEATAAAPLEAAAGSVEDTTGEAAAPEDADGAAATASAVAPPPRPKKIPGVFANQSGHGAMAAMAAAMKGRAVLPPPRPAKPAGLDAAGGGGSAASSAEDIAGAGDDDADAADDAAAVVAAAPVRPPPLPPHAHATAHEAVITSETAEDLSGVVAATPLHIKRKENSVSGDDRAIERAALDWLNAHLAARGVVLDSLFGGGALADGLNLIYALEDATGEPVGKYNKRAMLPVHRIDNIAVALNFLAKRGINTHFLTPQDILNEDKSKILTLFNYIVKKF